MTSADSTSLPVHAVSLDIPVYSNERGLWREVGDGHVFVEVHDDDVNVRGDRQGLVWLAVQLLALAGEGVPDGYHHHIDLISGELAEGSKNLILEYDARL